MTRALDAARLRALKAQAGMHGFILQPRGGKRFALVTRGERWPVEIQGETTVPDLDMVARYLDELTPPPPTEHRNVSVKMQGITDAVNGWAEAGEPDDDGREYMTVRVRYSDPLPPCPAGVNKYQWVMDHLDPA